MNRQSFISNALMALSISMLPKCLLPSGPSINKSNRPYKEVKNIFISDEPTTIIKGAMYLHWEGEFYLVGAEKDF